MPAKLKTPNTRIKLFYPGVEKILKNRSENFDRGQTAKDLKRWRKIRQAFKEKDFEQITGIRNSPALKKAVILFLTAREPDLRVKALDKIKNYLKTPSGAGFSKDNKKKLLNLASLAIYDPNEEISAQAISLCGTYKRESALLGIIDAANSPSKKIRTHAVLALTDFDSPEVVMPLIKAFNSLEFSNETELQLGRIITECFAKIYSEETEEFISQQLTENNNDKILLEVLRGLQRGLKSDRIEMLCHHINALYSRTKNLEVKLNTIALLARGHEGSHHILLSHFPYETPNVKIRIVEILLLIGDTHTIRSLKLILAREKNKEVLEFCRKEHLI
ncbi:MAG: HEAT repeat domain-containing protein [Candidatus Diapherotrites archaeon]|nr:HEAT repeat domain-containing protein [Candidatus Diapherotrites archaeon]